jgi:hypothetical protein
MTDFYQLIVKVASLPFHNDRSKAPAEIATQALIGEAIAIKFKPT